jgi:hypothetical protein
MNALLMNALLRLAVLERADRGRGGINVAVQSLSARLKFAAAPGVFP